MTGWQKARFLWHVWRAWNRAGSQRFGQLVVNVLRRDPFYAWDVDAERAFKGYPAGWRPRRRRK